jgi:hypothetical protein
MFRNGSRPKAVNGYETGGSRQVRPAAETPILILTPTPHRNRNRNRNLTRNRRLPSAENAVAWMKVCRRGMGGGVHA